MTPSIKDHIIASVLNQIRHERGGYDIASSTVKSCVDIFLNVQADRFMTLYKRDLEPIILRQSEEFYNTEGIQLLNSCDAAEFLKSVSSCIVKFAILTIFRSRTAFKRRTGGRTIIFLVKQRSHFVRS
jgi:hypothetical protein